MPPEREVIVRAPDRLILCASSMLILAHLVCCAAGNAERISRRRATLATVTSPLDNPIAYVVQDDPDPGLRTALINSLVEYNGQQVPPENHRPLAVFARNGEDIIGGAIGYTHWNWLFVSHLWVHGDYRGSGIGGRLMGRIEHEAQGRGAEAVHLDTYDFQALPFYLRLGYEEFGHLRDYPTGYSRHFLWKRLV